MKSLSDVLNGSPCQLCPHKCNAARLKNQYGFCGAGTVVKVFRSGPHHGEEPPISGNNGSGTVFFSHCTLKCCYCQNYPWSQEHQGDEWSIGQLAQEFVRLREKGCHNWNWVSPTPWLPQILDAHEMACRSGRLPVVYNTSGYERVDVINELKGTVDVYLTDMRYAHGETAKVASCAADYVEVARASLKAMWESTGEVSLDKNGFIRKGTICRILILPGCSDQAIENLEWINRHIGNKISISLMSQYTPAYKARDLSPWDRVISMQEYEKTVDAMVSMGFTLGWVQEFGGPPPDGLLGATMPAGVGIQ